MASLLTGLRSMSLEAWAPSVSVLTCILINDGSRVPHSVQILSVTTLPQPQTLVSFFPISHLPFLPTLRLPASLLPI